MAGQVVRRPLQLGARVQILGLLEARLTASDRVVLGGLVEGTWPQGAEPTPGFDGPCGTAGPGSARAPYRPLGRRFRAWRGAARSCSPTPRKSLAPPPCLALPPAVAAVTARPGRRRRSRPKIMRLAARALIGRKVKPAPPPPPPPPRAARPAVFGDRNRKLAARSAHDYAQHICA